jgi:hypothetical protein
MVERYGMPEFLSVYRTLAVTRDPANCDGWQSQFGCVDSVETMTAALDSAILASTGEHFDSVASDWKADVDTATANLDASVSPDDAKQILDVVHTMQFGAAEHDADLYRSALEGIYCDVGGEEMRQDIATNESVSTASPLESVLSITATGIASFPTAQVKAQRADGTIASFTVENTPGGWRLTGGDGWN